MKYADKRFVSNPGSPIHQLYSPKVMSDGSVELVECGKENIDDFIQSFKESTDINYILTKLSMGDTSVLHKSNGMYGDFTGMPSTFAEVLQLQIDSRNLFYSLPVEVRRKFDNDPNQFFAQSGNEEWFEKIKPALSDEMKEVIWPSKPVPVPVDPPVVEKEVKE